jgi:DNA-directed RNA polymerase specialized sigma24 family protein
MGRDERNERYRRLLRVVNAAVRLTVARGRARADLDDFVGEVWLHLVEKGVLDQVDPARGTVEQLVFVAAKNCTLSRLRKEQRLSWQFVLAGDGALTLDMPAPGPEPASVALAHRDLLRALQSFKEDEREELLLSILHDLTAAEILELRGHGTDERAVEAMKKRLQRLKIKLGEHLSAAVVSTPPARDRRVNEDDDEGA